jgi:hypothetical protein
MQSGLTLKNRAIKSARGSVDVKRPVFFFHLLLLIVCVFGQMANFGSTWISVANITSVVIGPFLAARLLRSKIDAETKFIITAFAIIFGLSAISVLNDKLENSVYYLRDIYVSIYWIILALYWIKYFPEKINISLKIVTSILFTVAVLQFSYEYYGYGLNPGLSDDFYIHANSAFDLGYPSVMGNPNNYAAFLLPIIFIFATESKNKIDKFIITVCVLSLIIAGSRLAIFGAIIAFLMIKNLKIKIMLIVFMILTYFLISRSGESFDIYSIDKMMQFFTLSYNDYTSENSIGSRILTHELFFRNFDEFFVGSYSPSLMCPQFKNIYEIDDLMQFSPHSMLIELQCMFGLFGLISYVFLIIGILMFCYRYNVSKIRIFIIILICIMATTIPSNIFRSSQQFFSLTIFVVWMARGWDQLDLNDARDILKPARVSR